MDFLHFVPVIIANKIFYSVSNEGVAKKWPPLFFLPCTLMSAKESCLLICLLVISKRLMISLQEGPSSPC
jgi:hypothetical protein